MNTGCTRKLSEHLLAVCEKGDDDCRTCIGENCNSKSAIEEYSQSDTDKSIADETIPKETCIACNSTIDPMCATNTTFDVFEACPNLVNASRCYHMINATTGEHARGGWFLYVKILHSILNQRKVFRSNRLSGEIS